VFTVIGTSNLTTGTGGAISTPGAQVAVRDIDTRATTLVSQTMGSLGSTPEPVPSGAALTDNSTGTGKLAGKQDSGDGDSTASISADGTTVAWMGINIPAQAPANATTDSANGHANEYAEPLWRRITDGQAAPTRRILGGDDPTGPCPGGCSGPLDMQWTGPTNPAVGQDQGPERGSFVNYNGFDGATAVTGTGLTNVTPQLSADGRTVAILSTQPTTGQDPVFGVHVPNNVSANAFVVNMADGLSRSQALTRLTEWASDDFDNLPLAGTLEDLAISPEGDRIAFATRRTVFPYSPPALITPQLSAVADEQLYVADLKDGTMQLASLGFDGGPANSFVITPAFSADDGPIAFASPATNLVFGAFSDQQGGGEVFTVTELKPTAIPGAQDVGPPPPNPVIVPRWVIGVTVERASVTGAILAVSVPGAGRLTASALAGIPAGSRAQRRKVRTRTIARASAAVGGAGVVELRLQPHRRYGKVIAQTRGLYARIAVRFTAAGHPAVGQTVPVVFSRARKR
jgi:hypothetical protein